MTTEKEKAMERSALEAGIHKRAIIEESRLLASAAKRNP
jgi:hypothetical protein